MITISEKEIEDAMNKAYKKAGYNAYFGNGFKCGVNFVLDLIKKQECENE